MKSRNFPTGNGETLKQWQKDRMVSHWYEFGQNLPILTVFLKNWVKFEVQKG